jgi:hypothetical protein
MNKKKTATEKFKAFLEQPAPLIQCPACKKRISRTAETCPKCGHSIEPDDVTKADKTNVQIRTGCFGCLGFFIIGFILLVIVGMFTDSASSSETERPVEIRALIQNADGEIKINHHEGFSTIIWPDEEFGLTINYEGNELKAITMSIRGTGSQKSTLNLITRFAHTVRSIDPEAIDAEIGPLLESLIVPEVTSGEGIVTAPYNQWSYESYTAEGMGLMITATPIE